MHRDQKIGLALAVLLLGFAGAFCFRHQTLRDPQPLALHETAELDARIEQLPVRAYTQREGVSAETSQPVSALKGPVTQRGLADQVIRLGEPGSQQVHASGDLIDLFPGPPEPLVVTLPAERLRVVPVSTDHPEADRTVPSEDLAVEPQVLPTLAEQAQAVDDSVEPLSTKDATYLVKSGDTLSAISVRIYGTSSRYLDLYRANRDVLSDPNDLPVGTTLRIP